MQSKAHKKYNEKRISKSAFFRKDSESDMILYKFASTFDFTKWVKENLKEKMKND